MPFMTDTPNFHTWSYQNLANFATDAYLRMQEQQAEIEQLKLIILEYLDVRKAN
jgi:hypothetical protein